MGPVNLRLPMGQIEPPSALLELAKAHKRSGSDFKSNPCSQPAECWLIQEDVIKGGDSEWIRLQLIAGYNTAINVMVTVFNRCGERWCVYSENLIYLDEAEGKQLHEALEKGDFAPTVAPVLDLRIGHRTFELR